MCEVWAYWLRRNVSSVNRAERIEAEQRRLAAWVDIEAGLKASIIAARHGVKTRTVYQWIRRFERGTLRSTKPRGRPSRLSLEQKSSLRVQAGLYRDAGRRVTRTEFRYMLHMECEADYSIEHATRIGWALGFSFRDIKLRPKMFFLNERHELHG